MLRKTVSYKYFITLSDIWKLLANMEYDPNDSEHYFLVDGTFTRTVESSTTSTKDLHIFPPKTIENTFTGIGIFRNWDDEFPIIIIDHEHQLVRVFDPNWMEYASKILHKHILYVSIPFEQAFERSILFRNIFIETSHECLENDIYADN